MVYILNNKIWEEKEPSIETLYNFCNSRYKFKNKNYTISLDDSRTYYKIRHNAFQRQCCFWLGIPFQTDIPFSNFGIDSIRTPDYLFKTKSNEVILLEFTVTNKLETGVINKEYYHKYDMEKVLFNSIGVNVLDYYIIMGLDDEELSCVSDIFYISKKIGIDVDIEDIRKDMTEFRERLNRLNNLVYEFVPELTVNSGSSNTILLKSNILKPEFKVNSISQRFKDKGVNNYVIKKIMSDRKVLMKKLKKFDIQNKIVIVVDLTIGYTDIRCDDLGFDKIIIQRALEKPFFEDLQVIKVKGSKLTSEEFKSFGDEDLQDVYCESKLIEVYETSNYESKFKNWIRDGFTNKNLLANCKISELRQDFCLNFQNKINSMMNQNNIVIRKKNPFIFPAIDFIEYSNIFKLDLNSLNTSNLITKEILDMFQKKGIESFTKDYIVDRSSLNEDILSCEREMSNIYNEINQKFKKDFLECKWNFKKSKLKSQEFQAIFKRWVDSKRKLSYLIKEPTRTKYKNRVTLDIKSKKFKEHWDFEKKHLRQPKGIIYCHPEEENDHTLILDFLKDQFTVTNIQAPDSIFIKSEVNGIKLKNLVDQMYSELNKKEFHFRYLKLAHNLLFISRFCYSLLYYSNIKSNNNDFYFDNLGYSNAFILVKGGKKILRTKRSRLFRLFFPINEIQEKIMRSENWEIHLIEGVKYMLTPWRQLRIDYLKKGFEIYHNFSNYLISRTQDLKITFKEFMPMVNLKILGLFSQKRKLEIFLGQLRYLFYNLTGEFSNVAELANSMATYNFDIIISVLQKSIIKNYNKIQTTLNSKTLFDLVSCESFLNIEYMAEKFDESIFMTKSPFEPMNEHLKNLKSVLLNHDYFYKCIYGENNKNIPLSEKNLDPYEILKSTKLDLRDQDNKKSFERAFSNDFIFDPILCYTVGEYSSRFISDKFTTAELSDFFDKLITSSFTKIKTSKGMRSHDGEFWGKKGHDVIFQDLNIEEINDLINIEDNWYKQNKKIKETHLSIKDYIERLNAKNIPFEFDMKDKIQFKDSREIYVMTDYTKSCQNPVEEFFKKLCSSLENEIINIKSHVRPKYIHSKLFESHKDEEMLFCTLDCRKWAPRSNLWKYFYFVKGLSKSLPENFFTYFNKFWSKYFYKRLRVQKIYVEKLSKNKENADIIKHFFKRPDGDFELYMPYSFMMGMFNYLSSLMHACTQKYYSDLSIKIFKVNLNMCAHSDDSSGTIKGDNLEIMLRSFQGYEVFQKLMNHMFSSKKSNISKNSMEMISIMYINRRLTPMKHKFLTNLALNTKGSSYYDDISSVVSLVVSAHSNGASLIECYSLMISTAELIRKAYHIPDNVKNSKIPLCIGGHFNMHPLHLILMGSSSQETMLDLLESEEERLFRVQFLKELCIDYISGFGAVMNYSKPYYIRHRKTPQLTDEQKTKIRSLALYFQNETIGDKLDYINSLYDANFIYSLTNIDSNQLFLATLFYSCYITQDSDEGLMSYKIKDLCTSYKIKFLNHSKFIDINKPMKLIPSKFLSYMRSAELINVDLNSFNFKIDKTTKPLTYNTLEILGMNIQYNTVRKMLAVQECEELRKIVPDREILERWFKFLGKSLKDKSDDEIKAIVKYTGKDSSHVRSCYMSIPSNMMIDNIERFWTFNLVYNTFSKYISNVKPQLLGLMDINPTIHANQHLKHAYLIFKIMNTVSINNTLNPNFINKMEEHLNKCEDCVKMDVIPMIKEFYDILNVKDLTINPSIPFCIYNSEQRQGLNVWFGQCEFTLCTNLGLVEHKIIEGKPYTTWRVETEESLTFLWLLYEIFTESKGIYTPQMTSGKTLYKNRFSFNDLRQATVLYSFNYGIFLENSEVIFEKIPVLSLTFKGRKYHYGDKQVDFILYNLYDINEQFYRSHHLKDLQSYLFPSTLKYDRNELKLFFSNSKLFRLLTLNPEYQESRALNKRYCNNGLLANEGSFTRALAFGNDIGFTDYRFSTSIQYKTNVLEYKTRQNLPVLDMWEKMNFARFNFTDYILFNKISNEEELTINDTKRLDFLIEKFGLNPINSSIILFKQIFASLDASDIGNIDHGTLFNFYNKLIETIMINFNAVGNKTYKYPSYPFNLNSFLKTIKTSFANKDKMLLSDLIVQGLFRSWFDNPAGTWDSIKEDLLGSCFKIDIRLIKNIFCVIKAVIIELSESENFETRLEDVWENYGKYIRSTILELENSDEVVELIDSIDGSFFKPVYNKWKVNSVIKEEVLDLVYDDYKSLLELLNDEDTEYMRDMIQDREWEGGEIEVWMEGYKGLKNIQEMISTNDFFRIKIYHPSSFITIPVINKYKLYKRVINGVGYYITEMSNLGNDIEFNINNWTENLDIVPIKSKEEITEKAVFEDVLDEYEYYEKSLEKLGIFDKSWIKILLNKTEPKDFNFFNRYLKDIFKGKQNIEKIRIKRRDMRMKKTYLPGYVGLTTDPILSSELKTLFGENYISILNGEVNMTEKVWNYMKKQIILNYKNMNNNEKSLSSLILSIMVDVNISDSNDDWFVDFVSELLSEVNDRLMPNINNIVDTPLNLQDQNEHIFKIEEEDLYEI